MISPSQDLFTVLSIHWTYALVILVGLVVLIGWAMYQLSKSLQLAFAVVIGMLLLASVTLYNQMREVSSVSVTLAIGLALFYVVSQWLDNNKTVKERIYDVEEKR